MTRTITDNVIEMGVVSDAAYQAERAAIELKYPKGGTFTALKDQALSRLFRWSGWTQEKLATVEGAKQGYISNRLCFGRFLDFIATCDNFELPPNLSEGSFRRYWKRTADIKKEALRFREVRDLITRGSTLPAKPGPTIIDKFGDGKWHKIEDIAAYLGDDVAPEDVTRRLTNMKDQNMRNALYEVRKYGKTTQHRIVTGDGAKSINLKVLRKEIQPFLKELKRESALSQVRISPGNVSIQVQLIERLLTKLAN